MKKIKAALGKLFSWFGLNDLFVAAGAGLFCYGIWEIYPPAAMILAGAGMVWWGITGSRKEKGK